MYLPLAGILRGTGSCRLQNTLLRSALLCVARPLSAPICGNYVMPTASDRYYHGASLLRQRLEDKRLRILSTKPPRCHYSGGDSKRELRGTILLGAFATCLLGGALALQSYVNDEELDDPVDASFTDKMQRKYLQLKENVMGAINLENDFIADKKLTNTRFPDSKLKNATQKSPKTAHEDETTNGNNNNGGSLSPPLTPSPESSTPTKKPIAPSPVSSEPEQHAQKTDKLTVSKEEKTSNYSVAPIQAGNLESVVEENESIASLASTADAEEDLDDEDIPPPPLEYIKEGSVGCSGGGGDFPSHVPYLIVGAGAAGMAAARAIRASDPRAQVLLVGGGLDAESVGGQHHALAGKSLASGGLAGGSQSSCGATDVEPVPYLRPPLSKDIWRRDERRRETMLRDDGDMRKHSWLFYEPASFFVEPQLLQRLTYGGIALVKGDPVVSLDPERRQVQLASGRRVTYSACLLATGGQPRRLAEAEHCVATGADLAALGRVSYFRSIADYNRLNKVTKDLKKSGGTVAIVGGGFLGCELACSLIRAKFAEDSDSAKLSVVHVMRESAPMGHVLPPCLAAATGRYEAARGVDIRSSADLVSVGLLLPSTTTATKEEQAPATAEAESAALVLGDQSPGVSRLGDRLKSIFAASSVSSESIAGEMIGGKAGGPQQQVDGVAKDSKTGKLRLRLRRCPPGGGDVIEEVLVDHIVCTIGVDPRVDLAESAGLEVDRSHGGYLVNAEMEARAGVFVAGDCASFWDPVLGVRRRVEHLNFAEESGAVAGRNMAALVLGSGDGGARKGTGGGSGSGEAPVQYRHQSSIWSSLGEGVAWDAVGHVDARRLLTHAFFAPSDDGATREAGDDDDKEAAGGPGMAAERAHSVTSLGGLGDAEFGRLGRGVVFYMTPAEHRLVGILLWNLPESIYKEDDYPAPSRLNLARSVLAERRQIVPGASSARVAAELQQIARHFDLYAALERDYAELKELQAATEAGIKRQLAEEDRQRVEAMELAMPGSAAAAEGEAEAKTAVGGAGDGSQEPAVKLADNEKTTCQDGPKAA